MATGMKNYMYIFLFREILMMGYFGTADVYGFVLQSKMHIKPPDLYLHHLNLKEFYVCYATT